MKKNTLLFLLLLAFAMPWAAKGQDVFTFGGDSHVSSGNSDPYGGYYTNEVKVFLYDADEVSFTGDISALAFRVYTDYGETGTNFTWYMKDVPSGTTLSTSTTFAEYTQGLTPVYVSQGTSALAQGWNTTMLTNTFSHQSGNSILLMISYVRGSECTENGQCGHGAYFVERNDHTLSKSGTHPNWTIGNRVPSITFYTDQYCFTPTNLTCTAYTATTATLNWTPGGDETNWVLQCCETNDFMCGSAGIFNVSGTPSITLEDFTTGHTYYARVKADCGSGNQSDWSNICAFTPKYPSPTNLVIQEVTSAYVAFTFDSEIGGVYQYCFVRPGETPTDLLFSHNEMGPVNTMSSYVGFGLNGMDLDTDYVVYVRRKYGENAFSDAVSATFHTLLYWTLSPVTVSNVTPQTASLSWQGVQNVDHYNVRYRTAAVCGNPVFSEGFENGLGDWYFYSDNQANNIGSTISEYPAGIFANAAHTGNNGFRFSSFQNYVDPGEQNASYWQYLTSPEFSLNGPSLFQFYYKKGYEYTTEYFYVGYVDANDQAHMSEDIHPTMDWQLYELDLPADAKKVCFSYFGNNTWYVCLDDITVRPIEEPAGEWQYVDNIAATSTTLSSLVIETNYEAQVMCDGFHVEWSGPAYFRTVYDVPFTWDFEDVAVGSLPLYWTRKGSSTQKPAVEPFYVISGNLNLEFYNASANDANLMAVLPAFNADLNTLSVAFYAKKTYPQDGPTVDIQVGYLIDMDDANTFVNVKTVNVTHEPNLYTVYFLEAPANAHIAFQTVYDGAAFAIVVDNVTVDAFTCEAVTDLAVTETGSNYVDLAWNGQSNLYYIYYTGEDDQTYYQVATESPYRLHSLDSDMHYTIRVTPECNVANSNPFDPTLVSTIEATTLACAAPTNVTVSDILHTSATVTWTGNSESYTVSHRTISVIDPIFSEGFENGIGNWSLVNCYSSSSNSTGIWGNANHSGDKGFRFYYSDNPPQYLISPELNGVVEGMQLEFYYRNYVSGWPETFMIGTSTTAATTADEIEASFTFGPELTASGRTWHRYLATIPAGTKYICFKFTSNNHFFLLIDDIAVGSTATPAGEWQSIDITDEVTTANISGLTSNTVYEVMVTSSCDPSLESDYEVFTTVADDLKLFVTEGNWNVDANWEPTGSPTSDQDVEIHANVTIPSGYVAYAHNITFNGTPAPTLTIADGGQLKHSNANVTATVKKTIVSYGEGEDHWYLIANPRTTAVYQPQFQDCGLWDGDYDLYKWDPTAADGNEWRNYKNDDFMVYGAMQGDGYLYANKQGTELSFTGTIWSATGYGYKYWNIVEPTSINHFANWHLCGNRFVCDAYIASSEENITSLPYYKMNEEGTHLVAVADGSPVAPLEGFFYQATQANQRIYLFANAPQNSNQLLNITLSQGRGTEDNAVIRFDEGQTLGKFTFREGSSKIYATEEGKAYAVVNAGHMGEIPLSFEAEKNGSYTLSFASQEVSFSYLHLIDNLTGDDIDLLDVARNVSTAPSYTFNASTDDYESRFRLVFATGSSASSETDSFCFINSSGNLCIYGIEGEATVQVVDVMGHMLSSETFSGSYEKKIEGAPGVYLIRLINGDDVRVQKMVVR